MPAIRRRKKLSRIRHKGLLKRLCRKYDLPDKIPAPNRAAVALYNLHQRARLIKHKPDTRKAIRNGTERVLFKHPAQ